MLLLYLLIVWKIERVSQYPFNMYNIKGHQDRYCLLSYNFQQTIDLDPTVKGIHQATSYCLRPSLEENFIAKLDFSNPTNGLVFSLTDLRIQNISSEMLLSWSATIDFAEQYEIFLTGGLDTTLDRKLSFHKCTLPWFGPSCRFTFDYGLDTSFEDIVTSIFKPKEPIMTNTEVTCYTHLHCQTRLSCLDWREICDGKSDCLDSSDELNCWQLEVNECKDNEFRCHNGLCIPMEFFRDAHYTPDCLDQTDETEIINRFLACFRDPTFSCEERTCTPKPLRFSCGDGQCTNGIFPCKNGRTDLLPNNLCANAIGCSTNGDDYYDGVDNDWCDRFCWMMDCVEEYCAELYDSRFIPVILGHVRVIYLNTETRWDDLSVPDYVCYDETLCGDFLPARVNFNNLTCRRFDDLGIPLASQFDPVLILGTHIRERFRQCSLVKNETFYCNYSTMYQCENVSKCISKQHLLDGIQDCPYYDDESYNQSCSLRDVRQRFNCSLFGIQNCYAALIAQDGMSDCDNQEDEKTNEIDRFKKHHIYFPYICDGKTELIPVLINDRNETDETDCDHWICNNTYSRCDRFWLCPNGADEVDCTSSNCPERHHQCVFPNDPLKLSCLPIEKAGDNVDDCLGASDEPKKYSMVNIGESLVNNYFHCRNDTRMDFRAKLCDQKAECPLNDDEIFCTSWKDGWKDICILPGLQHLQTVEAFLCRVDDTFYWSRIPIRVKLVDVGTYPLTLTMNNVSSTRSTSNESDSKDTFQTNKIPSEYAWWCHRGVPIRFRINDNESELLCLCPPSYYGKRCQYQNQRVSLTVQIQATSDWQKTFLFSVTLIDEEKYIEAHDYVEYLPIRDCIAKYNIYLLYAIRPKNISKLYSVQIDAFDQLTLSYRASWIFPIQFSFLPVYPLSVLLKLPLANMQPKSQCWPLCIHGQCFDYINDQNSTFCRCEDGWSGIRCDVKHTCNCAAGSICVSDSICLCAPNRFGPRCHLFQSSCHRHSCLNGGQCVTSDRRYTSTHSNNSICICSEGYTGDRCEFVKKETRIDISFDHKISIPSSLLLHLMYIQELKQPNSTSAMKKIPFNQYSITFYISVMFHIAFAQISNQYYLVVLQENPVTVAHISTQVNPSHRCRSISELFGQTFADQHLLKRIKSYHVPCQKQSDLICFHDKVHLCLCTLSRTANCFEFNYNKTYDCGGYNYCENDGYCFQTNPECPRSSCACHPCYFGSKCQFSTKASTLSLDIILGYHIRPDNGLKQQPVIVQVTVALTTIVLFFGLINSFFTFQTFRGEEIRKIGCGLYLFASSLVSLNTVIVLALKFWLFLAWQIGSISNRSLVNIQCASIDFVLRSLLSISDWLNACVAIERVVNVTKGVKFNKGKSKQIARWIIVFVLVGAISTFVYDPIHRRLIDDEEEHRTWCVTHYSSSVQIFDWFLNILHFSLPFSINCISAIVLIIVAARTRSNAQKKKPFKEHLHEQLQQHKHLLISPLILVVLAIPRLIISFLSGCMKSTQDSWLYLIGYFVSFVPSMMTFVVFVLPSENYKEQFTKSMKRIWSR